MSDRLFAACCYGSDEQHTDSQPCPQDAPIAAQVTQADRDAAWAIARFYLGNGSGFPDQLRDGRIERHFTLDILAKHRAATGLIAAAPELLEALDKYAEDLCEGWCERSPDCANFDDCGGCLARRVAWKARGEA